MCLIPHNLLDLQTLLAISSLKKVPKKRKVSKASSGDGGEAYRSVFAFFANFANEGGVILFARVSKCSTTRPPSIANPRRLR